jgi:hypothetical protein
MRLFFVLLLVFAHCTFIPFNVHNDRGNKIVDHDRNSISSKSSGIYSLEDQESVASTSDSLDGYDGASESSEFPSEPDSDSPEIAIRSERPRGNKCFRKSRLISIKNKIAQFFIEIALKIKDFFGKLGRKQKFSLIND